MGPDLVEPKNLLEDVSDTPNQHFQPSSLWVTLIWFSLKIPQNHSKDFHSAHLLASIPCGHWHKLGIPIFGQLPLPSSTALPSFDSSKNSGGTSISCKAPKWTRSQAWIWLVLLTESAELQPSQVGMGNWQCDLLIFIIIMLYIYISLKIPKALQNKLGKIIVAVARTGKIWKGQKWTKLIKKAKKDEESMTW